MGVFCINEDDIIGKVGFGRSISVPTVIANGVVSVAGPTSACCEKCAKQWPNTELYTFYDDPTTMCICQSPREGANVKTEQAPNGTFCGICEPESLALATPRKECESGDPSGIACCPQFTPGDNAGRKETFVHENELVDGDCQKTCQDGEKFPNSVGMTQHISQKYSNGKPKCWCESGEPILNASAQNYHTCLF